MKLVAFASKSLSATECRYVNNECELLTVLPGLKKLYYSAYGRTIHVITDHKSLVNIIQKDLTEMSARLQRVEHQIHQYNVALYYRKGKSILLSDCLSRNSEYEKHMGSYLEDMDTSLDEAH